MLQRNEPDLVRFGIRYLRLSAKAYSQLCQKSSAIFILFPYILHKFFSEKSENQ
jgi:hypothetical protein